MKSTNAIVETIEKVSDTINKIAQPEEPDLLHEFQKIQKLQYLAEEDSDLDDDQKEIYAEFAKKRKYAIISRMTPNESSSPI